MEIMYISVVAQKIKKNKGVGVGGGGGGGWGGGAGEEEGVFGAQDEQDLEDR